MGITLNDLYAFFYSPWTKRLCCIFLIGECMGLWFFGEKYGNGIFKKFIPLIMGTVLFFGAATITKYYASLIAGGFGMTLSSASGNDSDS